MLPRKSALIVTFAMAVGFGADAAETGTWSEGHRPVHLSAPAVMLGATVPPGTYTLQWTRERGSEQVRIAIAQGRKILAAGKGIWVASAQSSPYEALVYRRENGADTLAEVRFRNSADVIRVQSDASFTAANPDASAARDVAN